MPIPHTSVVVGGSGAIGQAACQQLAARGDAVFCLDQAPPPTETGRFVGIDLRDQASVHSAIAQVAQTAGAPIKTLVHSAGILRPKPFLDLDEADFMQHLDVNLLGAFRVGQSIARRMQPGGGAMVFVTSIHGQMGVPERCAYAASKGAIASMVRVMAAELSAQRIRVNALAPGPVDGGMTGNPATRARWAASAPSNRVAHLSEVAQAAAMLTSEHASFINGQVIALDGGASVMRLLNPATAGAEDQINRP